jgi:hypothetical protein
MKTTIATLAALAALAAAPSGAGAKPDLPGTCDLLKNTACDLQPFPICTWVPDLEGHLYYVCIRTD